ncbi:DgyrCDS5286 [Dimorphilus gyrociliatus]|uniref:DgyrCDS5286 n=1 Tax=Dimorphilus gyrociliatus TaxID=2664684 RepID=A0A7I8VK35_9ANNE|nr:DgyrCDS5286 [Dimorphilus gyrociliatus]
MAQFGGKNPPWARPDREFFAFAPQQNSFNSMDLNVAVSLTQGIPPQHIGGAVLAPGAVPAGGIYSLTTSQPGMVPQQYTAQQVAVANQLGQPIATAVLPPMPTVSYAGARPAVAAPAVPTTNAQNTVNKPQRDRFFTGTVTKLHDSFGFVDEDVFFQLTVVKGQMVKVGDRVLVEASYNVNMPFKWNASRIQVLPNQCSSNNQTNIPGFKGSQSTGSGVMSQNSQPPARQGSTPQQTPSSRGRNQDSYNRDRERDRDRRERDRRDRERERRSPPPRRKSRSPRPRSRSPRRTISPVRPFRRSAIGGANTSTRASTRYHVTVAKLSLDTLQANVISLKSRYQNLYIPSDFFNAKFTWSEVFPLHRPLSLSHPCSFHVMHKEVSMPLPTFCKAALNSEPNDVDYRFSAKVMLLACPPLPDLYRKACNLAEDSENSHQHPTRLINFLVGLKGKTEPMAIGGAWSPSLDGQEPEKDPRVLINTAIRTTKALTGIDLSMCTQWYRFLEIRYQRAEEQHRGKTLPKRVETVVVFVPDVWRCRPSAVDWLKTQKSYQELLDFKLKGEKLAAEEATEQVDVTNEKEENKMDAENNEEEKVLQPSDSSQLDLKSLKLTELQLELESRNINSKGIKSQLIARLTKALKNEGEVEASNQDDQPASETPPETDAKDMAEESAMSQSPSQEAPEGKEEKLSKWDEEEKKRREEREKSQLERRYTLPDSPAIICHPSTTAKNGKFDCTVMSLSVLLDYRPEDNKEHSFEVSLFAELFNEMLSRDFGFMIYKSLLAAPEKPKEDKPEKTEKKKENTEKNGSEEPESKKVKLEEKTESEEDKKEKETRDNLSNDADNTSVKSDEKDDEKRRRRDKKEERRSSPEKNVKHYTAIPKLLLAFAYFDQNHSGYLLEKDCEDIIHTIGLHLSRSQIKKIVQKVSSRDTIFYRKLTDKAVQEGEEKILEDSETLKEARLASEAQFYKSLPSDEEIGKGNRPKIEEFKCEAQIEEVDGGDNHLIIHKGAVVDIEQILSRLETSEMGRLEVERRFSTVKEELDFLKRSVVNKEAANSQLQNDVIEVKRRLREQKRNTDFAESRAKHLVDSLRRSHDLLDRARSELANALSKDDAKRERESEREKREEKERRERELKLKLEKEEKNKEREDKRKNEEQNQSTNQQVQTDIDKKPEESKVKTEAKEDCNAEKKTEDKKGEKDVKDNCKEGQDADVDTSSNKQAVAKETDNVGQSS